MANAKIKKEIAAEKLRRATIERLRKPLAEALFDPSGRGFIQTHTTIELLDLGLMERRWNDQHLTHFYHLTEEGRRLAMECEDEIAEERIARVEGEE